jgi:hypothetical protein
MTSVKWPEAMRSVLLCHMQQVHVGSKMPPLFAQGQTVLDAMTASMAIVHRQFPSPDERAKTECVEEFILDLFEQCCVCSFLTPKERRQVLLVSQRVGRKPLPPKSIVPSSKKRRTEDHVNPKHYSTMLSAEYLVRFLACLPLVLDHFQRMAGNTKGFAAEALWSRVQCLLEALAAFKYFPMELYLPIV